MGRFICQYIKKDGSMCGKGCMSDLGCFRHFNALPRTICPICNELTYSDTGICSTHSGIYDHAWCESKKLLRSKIFRRESFSLLPYCRCSSKAKISCQLT